MEPIYIQLTDDTRLVIQVFNTCLQVAKEQWVRVNYGDYNIDEGWDDNYEVIMIPLDKLSDVAEQINRMQKLLVLK